MPDTRRQSIPIREIQAAHDRASEPVEKRAIQRVLEWMRTDQMLVSMLHEEHIEALRNNGVSI